MDRWIDGFSICTGKVIGRGGRLMASHWEKLISGIGGFVAILCVFWVTAQFEQSQNLHSFLVASFGATAVLLFAAPSASLSQPWNVVGGHVVSALIGVSIYQLLPDAVWGAAIAVGLSITAMYYLRCLHPPGGASAAIPFLTSGVIEAYGYEYVFMPIGLGAVLMVFIAVLFNYPFVYRRYPAVLSKKTPRNQLNELGDDYGNISHADLVYALSEIDTYVDISEEELLRIYELATGRKHPNLKK